jgi:hypothetical protein
MQMKLQENKETTQYGASKFVPLIKYYRGNKMKKNKKKQENSTSAEKSKRRGGADGKMSIKLITLGKIGCKMRIGFGFLYTGSNAKYLHSALFSLNAGIY